MFSVFSQQTKVIVKSLPSCGQHIISHISFLSTVDGKRISTTACVIEYWMIHRRPGFLAVVKFGSLPPPPLLHPPLPLASCLSFPVFLIKGGGGAKGLARNQILRPQEILALYKPFNTLWPVFSGTQSLTTDRNHSRGPFSITYRTYIGLTVDHQSFFLAPLTQFYVTQPMGAPIHSFSYFVFNLQCKKG